MDHCKTDEWSLFELNGCPGELMVYMFRICKLAWPLKEASATNMPAFDMDAVLRLENEINQYHNEYHLALDSDDHLTGPNWRVDIYDKHHCVEAWRGALLLYILRVFKSKWVSPQVIGLASRVILDHIQFISRTGTVQKQVLLPMFLAAAEVSDRRDREMAQEYCRYWTRMNGYSLFKDAEKLLMEIWRERDASEGNDFWWAMVIDRYETESVGSMESPKRLLPQFLLG